MRLLTLASLALALNYASPAYAASKNFYSKADFKEVLDRALTDIYKRDARLREMGIAGKGNAYQEAPALSQNGAWQFTLSAACQLAYSNVSVSNNAGKFMTYNAPAVVTNNGGNFVYQFQTQSVGEIHKPEVEKVIEKLKKELAKEYADVSFLVEPQKDGSYLLRALYNYGTGTTDGRINDRLVYYMSKSKFLLCDIVTAMEIANANNWKRLKGPLTPPLSRDEFLVLYPTFQESGYAVQNDNNPYGQWASRGDGYRIWIENLGDKMKFWVYIPTPAGLTQEKATELYNQLTAIPPVKGASATEVQWDASYVWVGCVYPYAGMTGRDLGEELQKFFNKNGDVLFKAVKKIMK